MPKKSQGGRVTPAKSPAFANGIPPVIALSGAFASALGSKPQLGHPGTALPARLDKKLPVQGSSPQGKGNAAARPSYVPGKGHK